MRSILKLLLLPLLAYAGAMGYLWYELKNGADELVVSAASFADIRYGSVYLSPLGDELGYDDVVIKPAMTQDEFRIGQIRLSGPYPGYFILEGKGLKDREPPKKLGVAINRLKLDLNSEIFTMLEQMEQQQAAAAGQSGKMGNLLFNLDAQGCGSLKSFTLSDYRGMGIGATVSDFSANVEYDETTNKLQIESSMKTDGLQSIGSSVEFKVGPGGTMSPDMITKGIPKMTIHYKDTGYYQLRNDYCAEVNNSDVDGYIERHIQKVSSQLGVTFPEKATDEYRKLMHDGGEMTIRVDQVNNTSLDDLKYYKTADVIYMLGLDVTINGISLDLGKTRGKDTAAGKTADTGSKDEKNVAEKVVETKPEPEPQAARAVKASQTEAKQTAKTISVSDAGKYINKTLEITTEDGRVRSGVLEKVNNNRLYLVMKLRSGTLSYPVETGAISKIRVKN